MRAFLAPCVGAAILILLVFLASFAVVNKWHEGNFMRVRDGKAQCALVFGASVSSLKLENSAIVRRVSAVADLFHAGRVSRVIFTGGYGDGTTISEAQAMEREAIARGVARGEIVREDAARTTKENLEFSLPLIAECSSIVAISDRSHLARIFLLARREGIGLMLSPTTLRPTRLQDAVAHGREVIAYTYYALMIDRLFIDVPFKKNLQELEKRLFRRKSVEIRY